MAAAPANFANASLYVGDLLNEVTEALLFEIFNAVGPVASVRVCRDAATRRSLGYAYVNYHRLEDAERALDTMNFKNIRNRPCRIMWSHRDPSLRKSGAGNIFVKNLAPSIDNKSLYDTFSMFGNILSCKVSMGQDGNSLGYGFVHYEQEESAQTAIQRVDGKVIAEHKVTVEMFKPKKERSVGDSVTFTNVYVKNIGEDSTEEAVRELFAKHGEITSIKLNTGFGFVNYETAEAASSAVDTLNNLDWNGQKLTVCRAQRKDERERELKERFNALKEERQKKYEGVNLYVKNLSETVTEDKLEEEFKAFGKIASCKIMIDQAGKPRGFGFVCFASPEDAAKALAEMNGRMLDQKPLYVSPAQRKEARRQQLEMQHGQRKGMQPQGMPMYPPQGGPVFYAQGMPPRANFMYPQQMMPRRGYPGQPGAPLMSPRGPGGNVNYSLMPVPNGQRGAPNGQGPSGRGGARNNRRGQQGQPQGQGGRRQQGQPQMRQPETAAPEAVVPASQGAAEALTIKTLAAAPEELQKQMIGERLFPLVKDVDGPRAGKITGMLLEMDNGELLHLLESNEARQEKISEAVAVLDAAAAAAN